MTHQPTLHAVKAPGDAVSTTLATYADRGVFRGFRATPQRGGRVAYAFKWLWRRPMQAVFDTRRGVLTFNALCPGVEAASPLARDLRLVVASRSARDQPEHRRFDARRARLSCAVRRGDWSLAVEIRGANHEYAVRRTLSLINELFLRLQENYPEYLVEHFGLSTE